MVERDRRTPEEMLEDLLEEIEKDMDSGKSEEACKELEDIGEKQQNLLYQFTNLYQKYMLLYARC